VNYAHALSLLLALPLTTLAAVAACDPDEPEHCDPDAPASICTIVGNGLNGYDHDADTTAIPDTGDEAFDVDALGARALHNERLDQLVIDHILGLRP